MNDIYSYRVKRLEGETVDLDVYRGNVLLVVNTASHCGFTPQYRGLENLQQTFKSAGFSVLGFPCNQFGKQELGDNRQIAVFCQNQYAVSFPMFEKIEVNGQGADPFYQYLKNAAPGVFGTKAIKWNFTKFLVDRHGKVRKRYGPLITPDAIKKDIEILLKG